MSKQRGRAVLLITILCASVALLAWSVFSTWKQVASSSTTSSSATIGESATNLPPPLDSAAAKAKLFYPVMKSRGPQPGGSLQSKPLGAESAGTKKLPAPE